MPTALKSGVIADPVHGYVRFTGIERLILQHRVAQRMRYVSQTGLAHLVYPESRTSRFSHSLGAMHLASEFFAASLRNPDANTRRRTCEAIREAVQTRAGMMPDIPGASKRLADDVLLAHHYCDPEFQPVILFAEQAVRLAALFHDLGHLPFSHDFEEAIELHWHGLTPTEQETSSLRRLLVQTAGETKLHERLGHALSLLLLQDLYQELDEAEAPDTVRLAFELAQNILHSHPTRDSAALAVIYWLHVLVDGEVDVDRCDYILRDGRNYGFEFASFDLRRLLDNLTVYAEENYFGVAVRPHGISAVESFLEARFRSYQYGVRHHKVAQIGIALRNSIVRMLSANTLAQIPEFLDILSNIMAPTPPDAMRRKELLNTFSGKDDTWWMGLMRGFHDTSPDEWLGLVCWRHPGPRSLWKWRGDFPVRPDELATWNNRLPESDDLDREREWFDAVSRLKDDGVLVIRHRFAPWKKDQNGASKLMVREDDGAAGTELRLVPLSKLSPNVKALDTAWMEDVQVHAFAASGCTLRPNEVLARLP